MASEAQGRKPSGQKRLLGFNPETEAFEHIIVMDPDDVVRSDVKWLQSADMDSKMNIYVYERQLGRCEHDARTATRCHIDVAAGRCARLSASA